MQIGDLVMCPESGGFDAYVGLVIEVAGHKCTVLGGNRVSWDGVKGRCTWDMCDLTLVREATERQMQVGDLIQTTKGWSYKTWTGVVLEFEENIRANCTMAKVLWTEASQIDGQIFWAPINKLEVVRHAK